MPARDYAAEGRTRKAVALACVLHATLDGAALLRGDTLADDTWRLAAGIANVRPPSDATKQAVVAALKAIAEDEARHPDPFAAFTGSDR